MKIISLIKNKAYLETGIKYFQEKWATEDTLMLYQDAITQSMDAKNPLPQWYIVVKEHKIIACAGLIPNDFISRCELYPWLCALFVESEYRNQGIAGELITHIESETKLLGFNQIHLCTDLNGFYEKKGYYFNGLGYHPWGESSSVYSKDLSF